MITADPPAEKGKRVKLRQKGLQLDLGGIAQGYAADRCLQILRHYGITRALADAGGDIALGDAPPHTNGWEISIPGPDSSRSTLVLHNCGITTSGAKYRFLEVDGIRYSHIIDPRTGWGLQTHTHVTVQAPLGVEADAWATALSVLGEQGWKKLQRKHPELKVWLYETPLNRYNMKPSPRTKSVNQHEKTILCKKHPGILGTQRRSGYFATRCPARPAQKSV